MTILTDFIHIIEYILLIYFGFGAIYILIFALASLIKYKPNRKKDIIQRKTAVLIPGYKEDAVIVDVAKQALLQSYKQEQFDVVVIADSFQSETLQKLNDLPIKVIEVSFEKSTKSKALNKAMEVLDDDYEIACILDADNIMAEDVLERINEAFENGYKVVQGHRVAKNLNTSFAILDAVSEELNNNIFRKGHRVLGLSSALIGSGMAFDYAFFKSTMKQVNAVGGFDKELELRLLKNKQKIEYLPDAIVYDEKIQKSDAFANQRKRWLSAQFVYFRRYVLSGLFHLIFNGNIDFFDKVYQMISPPRILLLGLVGIMTIAYWMIELLVPNAVQLAVTPLYWTILCGITIAAFAFGIPRKFYNKETLLAILSLPKAFLIMFASLFKLKGANKKFIHTQHGQQA
ncbi:glycosyl transferase family 2 [Marinifilum breve]|uniref:Glycosyl transferase family 2 n=1 Tax=Marinifilum breve TaxID=2184082 RepID=A0A2V3ZV69_9BACT|nr:glycosyltransferase family 2 protein [Marinifilum breve]PXX98834.1 glycosyl transferase family 2 [Marinifilum breve]